MIAALAVLLQASPAPAVARISAIPLAPRQTFEELLSCDLSGDDVADVCIATRAGSARRLEVHVRRRPDAAGGPAFSGTADGALDLPPDAIAFAAADVLPDAGREVLLYNATGVFAWRWRVAEGEGRVVRLVECELLWQLAAEGGLFHLQPLVADLDGDGREDLVIPEDGAVRVAFQRARAGADTAPGAGAAPSFDAGVLPIADEDGGRDPGRVVVRTPGGRRKVELRLGSGGFDFGLRGDGARPYLSVDGQVPAPQILDWDGDGDRDVLALTDTRLHVWIQEPRGRFPPERALRLVSPVPRDRRRALDVSFQARALDLDRDARADAVFFAQDQRSDAARTQALVFLQKGVAADAPALFGAGGVPRDLLVLDGFARPLGLEDVDGDGHPDLVAAALRPNLIDALRTAASERLETELYVFLNRGGRFSKRPDLVRTLSIQVSGGGGDGAGWLVIDFCGDLNGDGVRELFLRTDRDRLRVHLVRKGRDGTLSVVEAPLHELAVDPEARVVMPGTLTPRTPDVLVVEKGKVVCASYR